MNIRLMTYNATGVMTAIPYLINTLKEKHVMIFGMSEHWLREHNKDVINSINLKYKSYTILCSNPGQFNRRPIGKGGIALLWH